MFSISGRVSWATSTSTQNISLVAGKFSFSTFVASWVCRTGQLEEIADTRLERLYDAVETGKIPLADLAPRIRDLRQRQEKLQAQKVQI
jgi:hypothetical protein